MFTEETGPVMTSTCWISDRFAITGRTTKHAGFDAAGESRRRTGSEDEVDHSDQVACYQAFTNSSRGNLGGGGGNLTPGYPCHAPVHVLFSGRRAEVPAL